MLRIEKLRLINFRCFAAIDVSFEPDVTVFFAENGGGKTAVLASLAMSLGLLQPSHSRELMLNGERDARRVRGASGLREPAGASAISCTATIGQLTGVQWSVTASPTSRRYAAKLDQASTAIERARQPGERWPLLGFYGTNRLADRRKASPKGHELTDRWDGYDGCLDPSTNDGPLLDWLKVQVHGDLVRRQRGEPERRPQDALSWDNLYLSCPTPDTCDRAKGGEWLAWEAADVPLPWPTEVDYENWFDFTSGGEMYVRSNAPLTPEQRRALELAVTDQDDGRQRRRSILNLNHPALVAARKAVIDSEKSRIERAYPDRRAPEAARQARAERLLQETKYPAFVSARVAYLKRALGKARPPEDSNPPGSR